MQSTSLASCTRTRAHTGLGGVAIAGGGLLEQGIQLEHLIVVGLDLEVLGVLSGLVESVLHEMTREHAGEN